MSRLFIVTSLLLVTASASADIIPSGFKPVRLSIEVNAEVPKGRVLVLANTFRGIDVIPVGTVEKVDWHPARGEMRVVSVSTEDADILKKMSGPAFDQDKLKTILARGQNCSDPFAGVRTLPDSNPASEVRWRFRIAFKGDACQTEEFATQYLSKDGKVVGAGADNTVKPTTPPEPSEPTPPPIAPTRADPSATPANAPPLATQPTKSGCGSCGIGAPSAPSIWSAGFLALFGVALSRRRRNP